MKAKSVKWCIFIVLVASVSTAYSYSSYQRSWDREYPNTSLKGNCTVCHTGGNTSKENSYCKDWDINNQGSPVDFLDSDGDGADNITEINAGTFPGDASSTPNVNNAPDANSMQVTTPEDTDVDILLTGSDADGDSLTFQITSQPTNGSLSGTIPDLTYTPDTGYFGVDSFKFRVNDGVDDSSTATVTITVTEVNVNTAPVADAQQVSTPEDTDVDIQLTGSDADGDSLTYRITSQPKNGSLSGTIPDLTYTPDTGYFGADSFKFIVNDGTIDSSAATVAITVTEVNVNTAPVADAQQVNTPEDTDVDILLTGSDADGDSLTYRITSQPKNGSLSGNLPDLTYTPDTGYIGADSFGFRVNDGTDDSQTATVTVSVYEVNNNTAPVATAQQISTTKNTDVDITLTGTDAEGDSLTFNITQQPANGTLTGQGADLTYTPASGYVGADSFKFSVNDGALGSTPATITITVNPGTGNTTPVANNQSITVLSDKAKAITLTGSDDDGDSLTFQITRQPANGSLTGTAPDVSYTPKSGYTGTDSFDFVVNDGTLDSSTGKVTILIKTDVEDDYSCFISSVF